MSERPPAANREHHDTFCENEQWKIVRGATGRPVTHHRTYELSLWDGRILRTRISKPVDRTTYAPSMWSHILRTQLEVSTEEFWACVDAAKLPERGRPVVEISRKAVPLYLFRALSSLGVDEDHIFSLDTAGAAALHAQLLTESVAETDSDLTQS